MNAVQWARARVIFDSALDLSPAEREAYLGEACEDDAVLRDEVDQLLAADSAAGDFLLVIPGHFPDQISLQPEQTLCERYRIVRPLGDGGMGQVYEAHDLELGIRVALKTLRPEIARNAEVLARFRQEVRIALRITHPNICRTFHLDRYRGAGDEGGERGEVLFITMEFLDGETLQQRLKLAGRLTPELALTIAVQMAAALEAAHQAGIIHRDIKPGNVMLCADPAAPGGMRVVITDFGLAKSVPTPSSLDPELSSISHPGRAMGTLAYMAPEQLEAGNVTPVTDIYAFGLVLFEVVTGRKAFPDASTMTAAFRRLVDPPPSPQALVPDLPGAWETAILGCLNIVPEARFRRAGDVVKILEGRDPAGLLSERDGEKSAPAATGQGARVTRRAFALAAIVVMCVSLSWWGSRVYQTRAAAGVAPGTLIYLAPVKNESGDKQMDNITELVRAGLSQSAQVNLLDSGRVGDILQRMTKTDDTAITPDVAREIAMHAGARRVILGTVSGSAGSYRLDMEVQQPDNTPRRYREHWTHSWTWKATASPTTIPAAVLSAVRDASDWIRASVGESRSDIGTLNVPPGDVTTGNWEALSDYATGERLATRGRSAEAAVAFHEAATRDPGFALAHAREGDLLVSLDHPVEGYRAYNRALSVDLEHRLTRKERDFIKGSYANDTWDYAAGNAAFRDLAAFYENDYFGIFFGAYPLRMMGRFDEAVKVLNRAHELNPMAGGPFMGLAYNYMLLRDFPAAHTAIEQLRSLGRDDDASMLAGHLAFLEGRPAEAEAALSSMERSTNAASRSLSFALSARLEAEYGRYANAVTILDHGIAIDHTRDERQYEASKLLDRAYLDQHLGRLKTSFEDIRKAIELDPRPANLIRASSVVGASLADEPRNAAVHRTAADELQWIEAKLPAEDFGVITEIAKLRVKGEMLLATARPREALSEFRKASALDSPVRDREYMARALVACSDPATHRDENALREALSLRAEIPSHPEIVWNYSGNFPPGFFADQAGLFLRLAAQVGVKDARVAKIQAAYRGLRTDR